MARFYANENFPRQVVEGLRALGHDVETSRDAGHGGCAMSDEAVLQYALQTDRIVVTLNRRHFVALHAAGLEHRGMIVCTFDPDFAGQAQRIHRAVVERSEIRGALLRVNRP
jgi:hypothetical protein